MEPVDVLIHLKKEPSNDQKNKVIDRLSGLSGVASVRFHMDKNNFLFVSYDTEAVEASAIIGKIRETGQEAQLVGL